MREEHTWSVSSQWEKHPQNKQRNKQTEPGEQQQSLVSGLVQESRGVDIDQSTNIKRKRGAWQKDRKHSRLEDIDPLGKKEKKENTQDMGTDCSLRHWRESLILN